MDRSEVYRDVGPKVIDDPACHRVGLLRRVVEVLVLLLQLGHVSKRHVGLATSGKRERLAGAHRDRLHRVSGLSLEHWDQDIEEPRVLGCSWWWTG